MKVMLINGSPRENGNTYLALKEVCRALNKENIDTKIYWIGKKAINGCMSCGYCHKSKKRECIIKDDCVNEISKAANDYDGFVFGSPTYYSHPNGQILNLLDRMFYSNKQAFEFKPCASVSVARRAGNIMTLDVLDKYASISSMPIITSSYWNLAFGGKEGEINEDDEGLKTMYNLGLNMAWILKCIELGKKHKITHPENEKVYTNFIKKNIKE